MAKEVERMCRNCLNRQYDSWGIIEVCSYYEMYCKTKRDEIKTAKVCDRYIYDEGKKLKDDPYSPCATNGDYSPSSPWNAPGMSVRDFI